METFLRSYEQPAHRDSPTRSPARSHDQEDRAEDGSRRLFYGDLSEAARSHPGAGRDARGSAVCPLLQRRSRGVRYRGRDPVHGLVHAHGRRDTRDQASRRARCEDAAHRSVPHAVRGVPAVGEVAHRGGASPCRGPLGVVSRRRDEDTREAPAYRGVLAARALNYRSSIAIGSAFLAQLERRFPARSEEHTSELQSHHDLVCRLPREQKKTDFTIGRRGFQSVSFCFDLFNYFTYTFG